MEFFFHKPAWIQLEHFRREISFKNMPRAFIQVFRGKITNMEVESTIREKKHFMKEVLTCIWRGCLHAKAADLGEQLWKWLWPSIHLYMGKKNDLLFQDLRKNFECLVSEKITRTHFIRDPTSKVGQLFLCHLAARITGLIFRSSPPHSICPSWDLPLMFVTILKTLPGISFLLGFSSTLCCPYLIL